MAEAIVWTAAILVWPSGCRLGWQMSPSFRRFVAARTGRTGVTLGYREGPWKNRVVHKHETWYWEKTLQELERWEDKEDISNIERLFMIILSFNFRYFQPCSTLFQLFVPLSPGDLPLSRLDLPAWWLLVPWGCESLRCGGGWRRS